MTSIARPIALILAMFSLVGMNAFAQMPSREEEQKLFVSMNKFAREKNYDEAIKICDQLILLNKGNHLVSSYYDRRAGYWLEFKNYNKALEDLNTVVALSKNANSYFSRAKLYQELKNWNKAIADCTSALSDCKDGVLEVSILELRSACYESDGQKNKAIEDAQLAYRYEYFSGWLSSVDSVARIKRLSGKEPPVPVVSKEKSEIILGKIKLIDSLNAHWSRDALTETCGQKLGVANHHNWNIDHADSKTNNYWEVGLSDDEKRVVVSWSDDQCAISRQSLSTCFGEGKFIPAKMEGCLGYPPWLIFERTWGNIVCMMGEAQFKKEGLALSVSFSKRPEKSEKPQTAVPY